MSDLNRKETGMKIISAELTNFQSLSHKIVDIQGKSIVVVGKNGGSKSTILRAIQSPINSIVVPTKTIKDGEESANVKITIQGELDGEDKTFNYIMNFTEANQKGKVTVVDEDGNKISNKSIQRDIIGDVSFDVDEFIRLGVTTSGKISQTGLKEQVEVLRQFLTDDEKQNLEDLDTEYKDKFSERSDINKTVKILKSNLTGATEITEEEVNKYNADRTKELEEVEEKMFNMSEVAVKYSKAIAAAEEHKRVIEKGEAAAAQLVKVNAWLEKNKEPNIEELKAQQIELKEYTAKYSKIKDVILKHSEVTSEEKLATKITKRLKAITEEKKKSFETSKLPVKGLSFDEEGVYFEGLPFNGDHHPSSTIIRVGVQLAIAMNPNLKCIFIKDGSLFDKETFAKVLKFVEKKGYQLFIEMVDWNASSDAEVEFAEEFINK